jgi:hypothetical protein
MIIGFRRNEKGNWGQASVIRYCQKAKINQENLKILGIILD